MIRQEVLKIGMHLENFDGIYEITAFHEKGGSLCTVREVCFKDDDSGEYELGAEYYFTSDEVKKCLKHQKGYSVDTLIIHENICDFSGTVFSP